mmetsp:Transcript_70156/g.168152  ORF Transcript_70156/g.168152 Transcript_70156/m.168152 type:complete len:255 (+) Transcript_70156:247-1011(+)
MRWQAVQQSARERSRQVKRSPPMRNGHSSRRYLVPKKRLGRRSLPPCLTHSCSSSWRRRQSCCTGRVSPGTVKRRQRTRREYLQQQLLLQQHQLLQARAARVKAQRDLKMMAKGRSRKATAAQVKARAMPVMAKEREMLVIAKARAMAVKAKAKSQKATAKVKKRRATGKEKNRRVMAKELELQLEAKVTLRLSQAQLKQEEVHTSSQRPQVQQHLQLRVKELRSQPLPQQRHLRHRQGSAAQQKREPSLQFPA